MPQILLALAFLAAPLTAETTQSADTPPETYPGYVWESVADGIYVHRQADPLGSPVDGNSTVIVNDEDVIVVDTHINPAVARAVVAQIQKITDRPVSYVVNTHWHDDHVNGNHAYRKAFPEATFVSHPATRATLLETWEPFEQGRMAGFEEVAGRDLQALADQVESDDPERARRIRGYAGYRDALEPELPTMEFVYPDLAFDDRIELVRENRRIVVEWLGRGNTDGDAIVWLPDDDVLITGDVLVWPIPFAFDSPMIEWIETLRRLAAIGAGTIIPGHGEVQRSGDYLEQVMALLEAAVDAVRDAREAGVEYGSLSESVDLGEMEALFTGGDAARAFAWRSFFLEPGLKSAWASLGFPVPEELSED